jgi:hypothetical protein
MEKYHQIQNIIYFQDLQMHEAIGMWMMIYKNVSKQKQKLLVYNFA